MDETTSDDPRHREAALLLPWYVTGQLDDADRALVEAHLESCASCRAEVREERKLAKAVLAESDMAEQAWSSLRNRVMAEALPPVVPRRRAGGRLLRVSRAAMRPDRLRWVVLAQAACLVVAVAAAWPGGVSSPHGPEYRVLGNAPTARAGNVLAMFRPEASERAIRHALNASGARLVNGPTRTDAYVLDVAEADRAAALAKLRRDPAVMMAEPIARAPEE